MSSAGTYGHIVSIKRDGSEGNHLPLMKESYTIGRKVSNDITVMMRGVADLHASLNIDGDMKVSLINQSIHGIQRMNSVKQYYFIYFLLQLFPHLCAATTTNKQQRHQQRQKTK